LAMSICTARASVCSGSGSFVMVDGLFIIRYLFADKELGHVLNW
jgi:hypothetical protein